MTLATMFLPARLDVRDGDYEPGLGHLLRITLDGVEQDAVVAYDIKQGTLTRYRKDAEGRIITSNERALIETVHGVVTVELRSSDGVRT